MPIRDFSSQLEPGTSSNRDIDDDAPAGFRQELVDVFFKFAPTKILYQIISQCLGIAPAGNPYGGSRYAASRDVSRAEWPRVYNLISRIWDEVPYPDRDKYVEAVNRLLAAYRVAWDLKSDGRLHRILPPAVQSQVDDAFRELGDPRFASALHVFRDAIAANDDRPRRERDACANVMDALESVAKEVFGMCTATFGNVLAEARKRHALVGETLAVLQKLYDMANNHFRHGMTTPFALNKAEVDFVFVSCPAGILLFSRLKP